MSVRDVTLVVPCYNEADRLDGAALHGLVDARPALRLLLVDDGSTDDTERTLRAVAAGRPEPIDVLRLPRNVGKAEAVRHGLRAALAGSAELVGYFDADLSTPPEELLRLVRVMEERGVAVVMGARVAMLGADIRRHVSRHYLGRVFATTASLLLGVTVYDTQCGAKLFRRSPALSAALERPFRSRWAFDVELIGRLLAGGAGTPGVPLGLFLEVPLATWRDVPGSKLRAWTMVGALVDLLLIGLDLARRRRAARGVRAVPSSAPSPR